MGKIKTADCGSRLLDLLNETMDAGRLADAARQALAALPGRPVVVPSHDGVPLRCWLAGPEGQR